MESSTYLSETPEDLLSVLIFTFFPEQHRLFKSETIRGYLTEYSFGNAPRASALFTGSLTEGLDLPYLQIQKNTGCIGQVSEMQMIKPDVDLMLEMPPDTFILDGEYNNFTDNFSLCCFDDEPLFCKILAKHPHKIVPLFCNGGFLQTQVLNQVFRIQTFRGFDSSSTMHGRTATTTSTDQIKYVNSSILNFPSEQDGLLAIPVQCPEKIKQEFLNRIASKDFPTKVTSIAELLNEGGCHVIPKAYKNCKEPHVSWRISFSILEKHLAQMLNNTQRICYRVLKAVIKSDVNDQLPKEEKLPSYFLKTTLFWQCEDTSKDSWTPTKCWKRWSRMLDGLIDFLEAESLPHYFVPNSNLLNEYSTNTRSHWIRSLKVIKQHPLPTLFSFWGQNSIMENYHLFLFKSLQQDLYGSYLLGAEINPISDTLMYLLCDCSFNAFIRVWKVLGSEQSLRWNLEANSHLNGMKYTEDSGIEFLIGILERCVNFLKTDTVTNRYQWLSQHVDKLSCIKSLWLSHMGNLYYELFEKTKNLQYKTKAQEHHGLACEGLGSDYISCKRRHTLSALYRSNFLLHTDVKGCMEAVQITVNIITTRGGVEGARFSRHTTAVLDEYLLLDMVDMEETVCLNEFLVYHVLFSAYIKAGVFAEVCIPRSLLNTNDITMVKNKSRNTQFVRTPLHLLSAQSLLCKQYFIAFQCFSAMQKQSKLGLWGKLFCVAKLFKKCFAGW